MSWFFTPHAKARAKERYGLDLTLPEFSFISISCTSGQAPPLRTYPNGTNVYCVDVRGVRTFPVLSPDKVIITFQPADFLASSATKKHRRERFNRGYRRGRNGHGPQPYVRDRAEAKQIINQQKEM